MSVVLILWLLCGFLTDLPTVFSRSPWHPDEYDSGIEADESAKRQSAGCGSFDYANNTLKSPGYPSYYPNYMDCEYWVPIPPGMAMRIDFVAFDVAINYVSLFTFCYDYLKITNEKNHTFGDYCGVKDGFHVIVTGDYVVLKFHSDCCDTRPGYLLSFNAFLNGTQSKPTALPTAPPTAGLCGYVQNNTLVSPGYPNSYPNNMDCNYWVYIPYGKDLRIYFYLFEVNDCGYDYLKISNEQNQTFGSFCGYKSNQSLIVTGQYAVLTFHSDGSVYDDGYKLFFSYVSQGIASTSAPYTTPPYQTLPTPTPNVTGCGYVQNDQLTSPGYPGYYPHNMDCTYYIYIPQGKALKIDFQYFGINDCWFDYVKITNQQNQTFGTFCGDKTGEVVYVTGYYAVVTFHSDSIINGPGYKLVFSNVPQANVSTSAPWPPYTTYPPFITPSKPYPSYYPSMGPKCKLQTYIRILEIVLNEMDNVVKYELGSKFSVRENKARVKRALSNVQAAKKKVGGQKRVVREVRNVDELENRAAELLKRLDTKEAQSKLRALLNRKMAEARDENAPAIETY